MPSVTEMSLWIPGRVRVARRDGTVCRTRTCDSRFWRPVLCQLSEYGMKKAPLPGWAKTLAVFGC